MKSDTGHIRLYGLKNKKINLTKTVIAIKPKSENTEFNDGFKKLIANGAIEADSASQAIKIIKKGIKQRKTSLDDF